MSTEEILNKSPIKEKGKEPEDQENLKKSPNSNSTSSNSQENQEIMNHPYVQDL